MKSTLMFICSIIRLVIISTIASFVFWIMNIAYNYIVGDEAPSISKMLYGAFGIFVFLFIHSIFVTVLTLYRYHKDPALKK